MHGGWHRNMIRSELKKKSNVGLVLWSIEVNLLQASRKLKSRTSVIKGPCPGIKFRRKCETTHRGSHSAGLMLDR